MAFGAQLLFEKITQCPNPPQALHDLVTNKEAESNFLEFKGAGRIGDVPMKANWSTALSGFANTEGGVLIWGIRAAANPSSGIDGAESLDLVPDPPQFAQKLRDLSLQATVDPVPGVEYRHYDALTGGPGGLAVPSTGVRGRKVAGEGSE